MYDIVFGSSKTRRGASFPEFVRLFAQICAEHRRENRALLFAALVYDVWDREYANVVLNAGYWDALDSLSGRFLTVFAFNIAASTEPRTRKQIEGARQFFAEKMNGGGADAVPCPALVFFQVEAEQVIDSLWIGLGSETTEDAFNELRSLLNCARGALGEVQKEHRGNSAEMFHLVENAVRQRLLVRRIRKSIDFASWIKGLFA